MKERCEWLDRLLFFWKFMSFKETKHKKQYSRDLIGSIFNCHLWLQIAQWDHTIFFLMWFCEMGNIGMDLPDYRVSWLGKYIIYSPKLKLYILGVLLCFEIYMYCLKRSLNFNLKDPDWGKKQGIPRLDQTPTKVVCCTERFSIVWKVFTSLLLKTNFYQFFPSKSGSILNSKQWYL